MIKECALIGQSMTVRMIKDNAISISMSCLPCALSQKMENGEQNQKRFLTLPKMGREYLLSTEKQDSRKLTGGTGSSGNATNEQLGIELHWEHRSFKEQGIDKEPTIHIGAVANAL